MRRWGKWLPILMALVLPAFAACKSPGTVSPTTGVLAVFNAPKIVVHYDEIVNTYHMTIDDYNRTDFTRAEFEELFNLMRSIKDDPKSKALIGEISLDHLYFWRVEHGYVQVMTLGYYEGPTAAAGKTMLLNRRSDGKWGLISVGQWVS